LLEETAAIGIANRSFRLRKLSRTVERAEAVGNHGLVMQALEMAAKEAGGAFTDKHQVDTKHDVCDALADLMKAIDGKTRGLPAAARRGPEQE
jgi:hypothetical protein